MAKGGEKNVKNRFRIQSQEVKKLLRAAYQ